jgi:lipopolysaccharide/colanic/teichoic acid biosynthesis glycosyltransferase
VPWQEKLDLDLYYVDNQSLWMDCRILARTVLSVVRREGAEEVSLDPISARDPGRP